MLEGRMNKVQKIGFAILFITGCLTSYLVGVQLVSRNVGTAMLEVQAMLSFNHLKWYEELHDCIENGSIESAREKARLSALGERGVLSDLLSDFDSEWITEYIELRSENSIESFKIFDSPLSQEWTEPSC
ncbi:MAG: hypothetical protein COA96_06905 [SAR86 cluster bacterium]|uniref:Uncharacterized protein n=1 Tax=SAR86 cluster bacterium TaxID=2030880 RepID=A0A2A5B2J4_9GAMM|nr:MAG: hypothetical protein COA96_06905 [SAR86 cluster bacterium]